MKVLSVVGARPQFIKAAPVSRQIRQRCHEVLVHTGQHYDWEMSAAFFDELKIPEPDYNLGVGSGNHGWQTGKMLIELEAVLLKEIPDWVLVYGDTNSTLAGALAAAKLHIKLAHVEAGLRSFNWMMPEEVNRVLTDRCSQALFCPTKTAVSNLEMEGIVEGVYLTGDVMLDAMQMFLQSVDESAVLTGHSLESGEYVLATVHRASNTDDKDNLNKILACLASSPWPVLLPIHPRTAAALARFDMAMPPGVRVISPVGYLEMLVLEKNARKIMTDSGGVQKEAYLLGVPCITLREETEWVETLEGGWNTVAGLDVELIAGIIGQPAPSVNPKNVFGDGDAAARISEILTHV